MARYRAAKCKLCRREGEKLFLKGDRCFSNKCGIEKRNYAPGEHGRRRRGKPSKYSIQLREKQKIRRMYGLLENQFHTYFEKAAQQKGITGTNLLRLLERRLDNVVYRLGFCSSRAMARQFIRHNHFQVNGTKVNVPSFLVNPGDRVGPRQKSKNLFLIQESMKTIDTRQMVPYLDMDPNKMEGEFLEIPSRDVIPVTMDEQMVVELYSK
ncbi:MAG: 30S ribosomal protein S4 [Candidatus Krumholzibacteria bacterium]|nr:30S ribosomal protein S4 [Candidatus Krumholzibacteria bacterium]